jgi:cytochrome b
MHHADAAGTLRAAAIAAICDCGVHYGEGAALMEFTTAGGKMQGLKRIRVWDLPTRLFHWALAALIVASVVSAKIGGNATVWHFRFGYAVLTLMLFRIVWGMIGPRYARFAALLHKPAHLIAYARNFHAREAAAHVGHNPLGSLAVFALLLVVLAQAVAGLFANDDIANEGPLVKYVSKELSDRITWFHTEFNANAIYLLVGLHIAAIAFYYFRKRQNLVAPMITGDIALSGDAPAANDSWRMRGLALLIAALCAGLVYWLVN